MIKGGRVVSCGCGAECRLEYTNEGVDVASNTTRARFSITKEKEKEKETTTNVGNR